MNIINAFFSNELIKIFGWTLIHSIWQVMLIAILLKIFLILYKKQSSDFLYRMAVTSAILCVLIVSLSFANIYKNYNSDLSTNSYNSQILNSQNYFSQKSLTSSGNINQNDIDNYIFSEIIDFTNSYLHVIVTFWFIGIFVLIIRYFGGLALIFRLRTKKSISISDEWIQNFEKLKKKLKINKKVEIFESYATQIPIIIGYFKPIIFLPVAMLNSLPYDQVEAIILHELAHIKRNDFIINIIISFFEVVFFYHPGFLWINSIIKSERENCCDDVTVKACGTAKPLQNALVELHNFSQTSPKFAPALIKNNNLIKRIKRMKTKHLSSTHGKGRVIGITLLFLTISVLLINSAFSPKTSDLPESLVNFTNYCQPSTTFSNDLKNDFNLKIHENENAIFLESVELLQDTIKEKDTITSNIHETHVKKNEEIRIEMDGDGKILEVRKNGIPVPKDKYEEYRNQANSKTGYHYYFSDYDFDELKNAYLEAIEVYKNASEEIALSEEDMEKIKNAHQEAMLVYKEAFEDFNFSDSMFYHNDHDFEFDFDFENFEEDFDFIHEEFADFFEDFAEEFEDFADEMDDLKVELHDKIEEIELLEELEELEQELTELSEELLEIGNSDDIENVFRRELVEDEIIDEDDNMSFTISTKKFIVNKKKQSKNILNKYLKLYESIAGEALQKNTTISVRD